MTSAQSPGRIEMLNGVQLYYEIHGNGEPPLLLHGAEVAFILARRRGEARCYLTNLIVPLWKSFLLCRIVSCAGIPCDMGDGFL